MHPIPKFPRSHYLLGLEKFVLLFYKIIQLKFLLREMVSVFALLPCAGSWKLNWNYYWKGYRSNLFVVPQAFTSIQPTSNISVNSWTLYWHDMTIISIISSCFVNKLKFDWLLLIRVLTVIPFYLSGTKAERSHAIFAMITLWLQTFQICLMVRQMPGTITYHGRPRKSFTHCQKQLANRTSLAWGQSLERIFQRTILLTGRLKLMEKMVKNMSSFQPVCNLYLLSVSAHCFA